MSLFSNVLFFTLLFVLIHILMAVMISIY